MINELRLVWAQNYRTTYIDIGDMEGKLKGHGYRWKKAL